MINLKHWKYLKGHKESRASTGWWGIISFAKKYLSVERKLVKNMRIKQGIVVEEGKIWAAFLHRLSVAGSLKTWMVMIPLLNRNKAARAAPGACCSRKGSCRVSGGQPGQSNILRAMPGGSEWKSSGVSAGCVAVFYRKHRQKWRHDYMEMHGRITGTADVVCRKEKVFPCQGRPGWSGNIYP